MGLVNADIKKIPMSVKNGIGLLFGGWVWFLYSVYFYYDKAFWIRFLIGGTVVFFCVLQFKRWARILVLLSNAITILYCTFFALAFHLSGTSPNVVAVSIINVLLFSCSSYFLFIKTSADFFRSGENVKGDHS